MKLHTWIKALIERRKLLGKGKSNRNTGGTTS